VLFSAGGRQVALLRSGRLLKAAAGSVPGNLTVERDD
jgi:hypothetical protein